MESKSIIIKIKTLDNCTHEINIAKDAPVMDLKNKIATQINIPVNRQRIIFQGKLLNNNESLCTYKIEDGNVLHLVANPGFTEADKENSTNTNNTNNTTQSNTTTTNPSQNNSINDVLSDFEILNGILRTISETSFNRRNFRRRMLQERSGGFNIDNNEAFEILRQSSSTIELMLNSLTKYPNQPNLTEMPFINPFNFSQRKFHIGQWIDAKDTIDQWLEAQIINIRGDQAYIHYNGWGSRWDEWIDMNSPRIALFRTHTVQANISKYLSPSPGNPPDGDTTHITNHNTDIHELMHKFGDIIETMNIMIRQYHVLQNDRKHDKQPEQSKQQETLCELQNWIEERKSDNEKPGNPNEKNANFEDAMSMKSHRSLEKNSIEYDAMSLKSMKSMISTSALSTAGINNLPINFPDYISEEDSQERSEIQNTSNIISMNTTLNREIQLSLLASQLGPIFDRVGRLMIDLAPQLAILGATTQTLNTNTIAQASNNNNNPNLTFASVITNESGQTRDNQPAQPTQNKSYGFQIPIMLTPNEIASANNPNNTNARVFGENAPNSNGIDIQIHAVFAPLNNQTGSNQNTQSSQTQPHQQTPLQTNTRASHQLGSNLPINRLHRERERERDRERDRELFKPRSTSNSQINVINNRPSQGSNTSDVNIQANREIRLPNQEHNTGLSENQNRGHEITSHNNIIWSELEIDTKNEVTFDSRMQTQDNSNRSQNPFLYKEDNNNNKAQTTNMDNNNLDKNHLLRTANTIRANDNLEINSSQIEQEKIKLESNSDNTNSPPIMNKHKEADIKKTNKPINYLESQKDSDDNNDHDDNNNNDSDSDDNLDDRNNLRQPSGCGRNIS